MSHVPRIAEWALSETFAEPPRDGVSAPLARERTRASWDDTSTWDAELARLALPRPWQQVLEHRPGEVVFERFVGVTLVDLEQCVQRHGRLLPLGAWLTLALELFEAVDALEPERTRPWPMSNLGVGWNLSGELTLSLTALDGLLCGLASTTLATRASGHGPLAWLSPEALRGLPPAPRSVASVAAHLAMNLLAGAPLMRRETPMETLKAILNQALTPPSAHHPDAPHTFEHAYRNALVGNVPGRWQSARELGEHLRSCAARVNVQPWPRDKAVDALFALTAEPLHRAFAAARTQAAFLPPAWERVYPATAAPADALAVFEDELLERLPDTSGFPRSRQAPSTPQPQENVYGEPMTPLPVVTTETPPAPGEAQGEAQGLFARLRRRFGF